MVAPIGLLTQVSAIGYSNLLLPPVTGTNTDSFSSAVDALVTPAAPDDFDRISNLDESGANPATIAADAGTPANPQPAESLTEANQNTQANNRAEIIEERRREILKAINDNLKEQLNETTNQNAVAATISTDTQLSLEDVIATQTAPEFTTPAINSFPNPAQVNIYSYIINALQGGANLNGLPADKDEHLITEA